MGKQSQEWLRQAEYDMGTAEYLFSGGRYSYSVFLCHLAIEKALKALYCKQFSKVPPRVHNLIYLVETLGLALPSDLHDAVYTMNRLGVVTRYPEDLEQLQSDLGKATTQRLLQKGKEVLQWLREEFSKP